MANRHVSVHLAVFYTYLPNIKDKNVFMCHLFYSYSSLIHIMDQFIVCLNSHINQIKTTLARLAPYMFVLKRADIRINVLLDSVSKEMQCRRRPGSLC